MKQITLFRSTTGINNKVDPARLRFSPDAGLRDLAKGINVVIDDTGRPSRRKGFTEAVSSSDISSVLTSAADTEVHSIFYGGSDCLFVVDDALCTLATNYGWSALRNVQRHVRMSYAQVKDRVYYVNGFQRGYVENGVSETWEKGTYTGPETHRSFSEPPIGSLIAYHKGALYIAQGDTLWHSEPYSLNLFDLASNFIQYQKPIRMVRPVAGGIYVGTEAGIYFEAGTSSFDFMQSKVYDSQPVMGTDVNIWGTLGDGLTINLSVGSSQARSMQGAIWLTQNGICYGSPDGFIANLTEHKLDLPTAITGSGLIVDGRYVCLLDP